ncbi:MAG: ABC transporter substrate-binding protein [Boseongicola sp. SB0664_bin_43]|uniref:ABC transporter substrate-binding protein n=1 Tax=Boseongicola sp. SB0664_bin_43 TaxID=2604844 RepID=A0A6B0XXT0_9RHOB|nr:ABC transporter substrate-binding protein [Boseongicola sp. SB0664_bin_43]MYK30391.1 ABC transporter substrate-binding protein [Boseongicola sp. SB0670_bin_30]
MRRLGELALGLAHLGGAAVCEPMPEATKSYGPLQAEVHLTVRGTTDIALFEPVLQTFVTRSDGARIDYEQWASNDLYLATVAECRSSSATADLVVSSSIDQQIKLANDGCAAPYRSDGTARLPAVSNWRDEVFGITWEPAAIVYNKSTIGSAPAPKSRFDLIDLLRPEDSAFRGRVATYDIEVSGLGYLFAFADSQQATTFGRLIEAFGRSGAVATCCSAAIIDGVVSGDYLIAYNVLGSYALARADENPDIVVVAPDDYTLVLARAALIPRRAAMPELAGEFIDFLISEPGRSALRSANLIVDTNESVHAAMRLPENPDVSLRPIPLSLALLVGLDQHKRREFVARWQAAFPKERDRESAD